MPDQYLPGSEQLDDLRQQIRTLRGSPADTPRRADLCRQALDLVSPQDQPELWAGLQCERGICLIQMPTGNHVQNIEQALVHFQEALKVYTAEAHPVEWASVQHNLGAAYRQRLIGDRAENQEEAIRCYQCALSVYNKTDWPEDWADATFNLANVYAQRIRAHPRDNVERAIAGYEAVLPIYTRSVYPLAWAKVQCQLGRAWSNSNWNDLAANFNRAQKYYQAALSVLTRQDHPVEWSVAQHGLGKVWLNPIASARADHVTQAIQCFEAALQVRRREVSPDDWADTMHNLGVAYLQLTRGDRAKNIERAIDIFTQALEVQTPKVDRLKSAEVTCKLADAFFARIDGGRAENLQHAIRLYRSALLVQRRQGFPQDWGPTLHNLALAYSERRLGSRLFNLTRAAILGKLALPAFDPSVNLAEWANVKTNLIDILWKLANSQRHSDLAAASQNLEDAVAYGQEVLRALTGQAPSQRQALAHYNLGNAFGDRLVGNRVDNQPQAIWHYEQALQFYTRKDYPWRWADTHNNLGVTYQERISGDRAENLRRAIEHYHEALNACSPDTSPVLAQRAARNLGNVYFQERLWQAAAAAYQRALQASEHLYRASLARSSKEAELTETADLYRRNAYALACMRDYKGACVTLEQGRARLLTEVLERDWMDLKRLATLGHHDLLNRYQESAEHLRNLENLEIQSREPSPAPDLVAHLQSVRAELDRIIQSIRQISGYENFLQTPVFEQIQRDCAINSSSAGVYLTVTEFGGVALIFSSNTVTGIRLDDFSAASLDFLLTKRTGNDVVGGYLPGQFGNGMDVALDEVLPILGKQAVAPIAECLRQLNVTHVVLIPTGLLGLFPLHAVQYSRGGREICLLDEFHVTYAHSSRVLGGARRRLESRQDTAPILAGVGNPLDNPKLLPYAQPELEEIATFFAEDARHLSLGYAATKETLLAASISATYVHFACHGMFDPQEPLSSHLQLANGDVLTLREVMHSKHFEKARLVVLSACQTAIADFNKLPDEVIGLPAGFFQAGVPAVIGTLWSVNDASTMLLMVKFYEAHLKEGLVPAAALRKAQLWLRDVTAAELSEMSGQYRSAEINAQLRRFALLESHVKPFVHPYYWAAFAFYGV